MRRESELPYAVYVHDRVGDGVRSYLTIDGKSVLKSLMILDLKVPLKKNGKNAQKKKVASDFYIDFFTQRRSTKE